MDFVNFVGAFVKYFKGDIGDGGVILMRSIGAECPADKKEAFKKFKGQRKISNSLQIEDFPKGSLGKEYADFLQNNHKKEILINHDLAVTDSSHKLFCNRALLMHDMLHYLFGFAFTFEGENALAAFLEAQNEQKCLKYALKGHAIACFVMKPWQYKKIKRGIRRGEHIGKNTPYILDIDFEPLWAMNLDEVKGLLKIPTTKENV